MTEKFQIGYILQLPKMQNILELHRNYNGALIYIYIYDKIYIIIYNYVTYSIKCAYTYNYIYMCAFAYAHINFLSDNLSFLCVEYKLKGNLDLHNFEVWYSGIGEHLEKKGESSRVKGSSGQNK